MWWEQEPTEFLFAGAKSFLYPQSKFDSIIGVFFKGKRKLLKIKWFSLSFDFDSKSKEKLSKVAKILTNRKEKVILI